MNHFFDLLEEEYSKHTYPADRIFNFEETGLSIVESKIPTVIALKGKHQVGSITSPERGSFVTLFTCTSAGRTFVPPMTIFPRQNMTELMKDAPLGAIHPGRYRHIYLQTGFDSSLRKPILQPNLLFMTTILS